MNHLRFYFMVGIKKIIETTQLDRTPSGLGEREWERGLKMYLGGRKRSRGHCHLYRGPVITASQKMSKTISKERCEVNCSKPFSGTHVFYDFLMIVYQLVTSCGHKVP